MYIVKVDKLFHEDLEPLQANDLVSGSNLLMDLNIKVFPVTFVRGNS